MAKAEKLSSKEELAAQEEPTASSAAAMALKEKLPASSKTVSVACKMPHGVVIRDFEKTRVSEPILGGGVRMVDSYRPVGQKIRIKGPVVPDIYIRQVEVIGGYAITDGVPADVYERWAEHNKDAPFILNKLVFHHENAARVRDWARDHASIKSGMEPLNVGMKMSTDGRQVYADERVRTAGADLVVDGKLEPTAA